MMIRVVPETETQERSHECIRPQERVRNHNKMDEEVIEIVIECPTQIMTSIEPIIKTNKEILTLTSSSIQEEAQLGVIAESGISAIDTSNSHGSPTTQEPAISSPTLKNDLLKDSSASSSQQVGNQQ